MFLLRRHMSFYLATLLGLATFALAWTMGVERSAIMGVNGFFLAYVVFSLIAISKLTPKHLASHAAGADAPITVIFLVTLGAVIITMSSLFGTMNAQPRPDGLALGVALASVPLAWATIHLMSALHYAHEWWLPDSAEDSPRGGLAFPQTPKPSGWDFAYFALTIGLCAQTSDVEITTTQMRRRATAQGIVAFFFNTVLVTVAVNLAITLTR